MAVGQDGATGAKGGDASGGRDRPPRDKPWIFRTYAGHSTAAASNALYRENLARGQTGLSIAFDLPTQTGHDPDDPLAAGEVGRVGVSIAHLPDMRRLLEGIPLETMNTSMTINATAPWLFALYVALADERGVPRASLQGTTQNDLVKEYLSRGTYVLPPKPSLALTRDLILFSTKHAPKWNPINVCSYHLQEAGATPVQELAYALATAIAVLDAVRDGGVEGEALAEVVGRISFFVNASLRFVTEICKLRAFAELWDEIARDRYGVTDEAKRRFRYGVQVNSLGLTESQPENNVHRILIEMLAVTLSKRARARAVQLPAWNEAIGLPRPWDQQWSLRMQQILAFETDLLEHEDLFDGSPVIERKVAALKEEARALLAEVEAMGGAVAAVETGAIKAALVASNAARVRAIEDGSATVVGVNRFTEGAPSPLGGGSDSVVTVGDEVEVEARAAIVRFRAGRNEDAVRAARARLEAAARAVESGAGESVVEASVAAAKAGLTTGEWGETVRAVFGAWRAPTGVVARLVPGDGEDRDFAELRALVAALSARLGEPVAFLVGKPGLDGHSNGAEQIATRALEAGFRAVYDGIRQTPAEIVERALAERPHVIGLSILSGSHVPLVREVLGRLRAAGVRAPVVVGGIVPPEDEAVLRQMGVARVFTPKDFRINRVLADVAGLVARDLDEAAA